MEELVVGLYFVFTIGADIHELLVLPLPNFHTTYARVFDEPGSIMTLSHESLTLRL